MKDTVAAHGDLGAAARSSRTPPFAEQRAGTWIRL